ncbi:MAG: macro domain-containing protein [Lawsonibacter sp.]|nr:macro domain-containing protein [Lawsonibacter sp.]
MEFREEKRDLFSVPDDYYLAHCISADFAMGKGIAVEFNRRFDMKNKLKAHYPDYLDQWQREKKRSGCILAGRVFNLITKERYFQKPTYETLRGALECMKALCVQKGVRRAAMPVIGCGLDRLAWEQVSAVIQDVFSDTGIEILVCIK